MKKMLSLAVTLLALLLVAAPARAADVDGKWKGSLDTPMGAVENPAAVQPRRQPSYERRRLPGDGRGHRSRIVQGNRAGPACQVAE